MEKRKMLCSDLHFIFFSLFFVFFFLCISLIPYKSVEWVELSDSNCETPENPDFLRNDKMVISVKIWNFSRSRMTKRTSQLESSREI